MIQGSSLLVLFSFNFRKTRLGQGIFWAAVIRGRWGFLISHAGCRQEHCFPSFNEPQQPRGSGAGHPTAQPNLLTQKQQQLLFYRSSCQKGNNQLQLWVLTVFDIQQLVSVFKFRSIRWNFLRTGANYSWMNYWVEIYIWDQVIFFFNLLSFKWNMNNNYEVSSPKKSFVEKKIQFPLLFLSSASLLFLSNC